MSSIDLSIRFNIGLCLLNRKRVTNAFQTSTDIIQVLNYATVTNKTDIVRFQRFAHHRRI